MPYWYCHIGLYYQPPPQSKINFVLHYSDSIFLQTKNWKLQLGHSYIRSKETVRNVSKCKIMLQIIHRNKHWFVCFHNCIVACVTNLEQYQTVGNKLIELIKLKIMFDYINLCFFYVIPNSVLFTFRYLSWLSSDILPHTMIIAHNNRNFPISLRINLLIIQILILILCSHSTLTYKVSWYALHHTHHLNGSPTDSHTVDRLKFLKNLAIRQNIIAQ